MEGGNLKNENILKLKPKLTICSNHQKAEKQSDGRYWNSKVNGTARKDGAGWYRNKLTQEG